MNIVLNGLLGGFFGRLEQRADVHIKAHIGIGGGDHLGTAVMAVLAHFGDHQARAAAFECLELFDEFRDV